MNIFHCHKPNYFYFSDKWVCQSSTQSECESDLIVFFVFHREDEYFIFVFTGTV
jgi:hypothetical protein